MSGYDIVARTKAFLGTRRINYRVVFLAPAGQQVLHDLAKFCRANETTFDPDPRIHAALEGRREVFLRITQHLNLSAEQMFDLYNGRAIPQQEIENA